jgi:hypothetical protein
MENSDANGGRTNELFLVRFQMRTCQGILPVASV